MEGINSNDESKELLDSSYELFTPCKGKSSKINGLVNKSVTPVRNSIPAATSTRSGRKIKKVQYPGYDMKTVTGSGGKNAPTEINILKNEFNGLNISADCSFTPKGKRRVVKKITPTTPVNENIISPEVTYSKSGRKIKKIQYSERDSEDSRNNEKKVGACSTSEKTKSTAHRIKSPRGNVSDKTIVTRSGRTIKQNQYLKCEKDVDSNHTQEVENRASVQKKKRFLRKTTSTEKKKSGKRISSKKNSPAAVFTKSGRKIRRKIYVEDSDTEIESDSEKETQDKVESIEVGKPAALYDDDNIVGKQLFGFHTPKHRNAMLDKASRSATKSRNTAKTPKSAASKKIVQSKTPYNMRKRIKKGIAKEVTRQSLDSFLEDSGSDYVPSSSSSDDSETDDNKCAQSEYSDSEYDEISGIVPLENLEITDKKLNLKKSRAPINNFIFTSDDYFENKNLRSISSNHTLSQLNTPHFNQEQLSEVLKSADVKHDKVLSELNLDNEAMFTRWLFSMNEGYNILVYGVGSKKKLLNTFHRQFLSRCYVIVINGYFPGLLLKDIFDVIVHDVLKIRSISSTQPHEIIDFISSKLRSKNSKLFVLVHNIDGIPLRNDKIQNALAYLASDPNVHLIATLDHINSPLLWDQNKLSQFNFTWEDGTSFLPYLSETSYESSLMVQNSGGIALAGLKNIFKSLNTNSRKIFKLLLDHQLVDISNRSQGMLFSELYRDCRNSFLISSDLALRTQLTEFFDHQLVRWKKDNEHLVIPLDVTVLKQFQSYLIFENE